VALNVDKSRSYYLITPGLFADIFQTPEVCDAREDAKRYIAWLINNKLLLWVGLIFVHFNIKSNDMLAGGMMDYPLTTNSIIDYANRVFAHKEIVSKMPDCSWHRYTYG